MFSCRSLAFMSHIFNRSSSENHPLRFIEMLQVVFALIAGVINGYCRGIFSACRKLSLERLASNNTHNVFLVVGVLRVQKLTGQPCWLQSVFDKTVSGLVHLKVTTLEFSGSSPGVKQRYILIGIPLPRRLIYWSRSTVEPCCEPH